MKTGKVSFKEFWHNWKGRTWFVINMFFTILYLTWRLFFTIPYGYGIVSIVAGLLLLIVEILGMVESFVHYVNMYTVKGYPLPEIPKDLYPDVDIFIATYSEDPELLYKTINGCKHMKYPDKKKVHIYLCDDNRRPEMRALAEKMGVNYLDRENNDGAKAGNLNHALAHSSSPYVVTFDADMIPKSDFLLKMVPYFVDTEIKNKGREEKDKVKLGFVQSPQSFYNPDLFQFNLFSEHRIPNEQDYFYKDIQVAHTKTNSVIYGGSNTMLSREALEAIGGFYTEAITEDFATGILVQKAGFVSLGTGEPLASGMSATDLQGLIQQRIRWARGVIATGRKMHIFTTKKLSFAQKMNYWASIWYWYAPLKRLIYILSPMLYATFGFMIFECTLPQVLCFWLPMYVTSNISLGMLSNNIRTTKWTSIYETVLFPYMLIPVLLESIGITLKKFKVTKKEAQANQKGKNFIYTIPFWILIILSVIGIIKCIIIMFDSGSFGPIVVLFWLVYNLFLLVMSLFFVDGRIPYRKAERVKVSIDSVLTDGRYTWYGKTKDISETGVSVILEKPVHLDEQSNVTLDLNTGEYAVTMLCEVIFIKKMKEGWNYSMKIIDYMDSYDTYLQIIYDRIPVLPQEILKDSGSFEDLKLNTQKRLTSPFYEKRKYPRVLLDTDVDAEVMTKQWKSTGTKKTVHVKDFNYVYVILEEENPEEYLQLFFTEGVIVLCKRVDEVHSGQKLYEVQNLEKLIRDEVTMRKLLDWLHETNLIALKNKKQADKKRKQIEKEKQKVKEEFDEKDLL